MGAARRAPQRRRLVTVEMVKGIIHQRTAELGKGAGRSAGSDEKVATGGQGARIVGDGQGLC